MKTDIQIQYERRLAAMGFGPTAIKTGGKKSDTLPDELVRSFGGVVGEYADYINDTSAALNQHTAFLGALAFCSFCASRRYRTRSNLTPELYLVALCPSGGGKDYPRKCNLDLGFQIGAIDNVVNDIASGEGGEDAIMEHAKILAQIDEFDTLLRAIAEDRGGTKESLVRFLLQAFTSAGGGLKRRQKARGKDAQNSKSYCHRPGLVIFGTGIKSLFFSALNARALNNGMFARMMVCPCKVRDTIRDVTWHEIPQGIVSKFQGMAGSTVTQRGNIETLRLPDHPDVKPQPIVVDFENDRAVDELARIGVEAETWYNTFPETEDGEPGRAIANRRRENVLRVALVRAISRDYSCPFITVNDLRWGEQFVKWSQNAMLRAASEYCFANPFDEMLKKVKRFAADRSHFGKRDVCRLLHINADEINAILDTLVIEGSIESDPDLRNAWRAVPERIGGE